MDTKRGAIVVGASLAALTAGWYIRRWYAQKAQEAETEAAPALDKKPTRVKRSTNGRHKAATN